VHFWFVKGTGESICETIEGRGFVLPLFGAFVDCEGHRCVFDCEGPTLRKKRLEFVYFFDWERLE